MSFLDRFRRTDNDDLDNDESVYRDGPHRSALTSFLFGFFALLVTLLIAAGIFFGGRAVYRAIKGNPDSSNTNGQSTSNKPPNMPSASKESGTKKTSTAAKKPSSTPSTGDNLPSTGDNLPLPKTGDPGM